MPVRAVVAHDFDTLDAAERILCGSNCDWEQATSSPASGGHLGYTPFAAYPGQGIVGDRTRRSQEILRV